MPRIPDQLSQSVVFLYETAEDALDGRQAGGSAFFVWKDGRAGPRLFLVTTIHVKVKCQFARIPTLEGGVDVLEVREDQWLSHPDGDDVAVAWIEAHRSNRAITALTWADLAATKERMAELNAGVGDEVFMLGRFVPHKADGQPQPLPRFGNIAMMPGAAVEDGRGLAVEAFLLEMRSLSGFSGSPVFIYIGPGSYRGDGSMMQLFSEHVGLIGIDTGHIDLWSPVFEGTTKTALKAKLHTGVSIVAPVWKIGELLDELEGALG